MKSNMVEMMYLAALLALGGCASENIAPVVVTPDPAPVEPPVCVCVYKVSARRVETAPAPAPSAVFRAPVANVSARAADGLSKPLAAFAKSEAESALVKAGYEVASAEQPDAVVTLDVSQREYDRLREWRVYEGRIVLRATDAEGRLLANVPLKAVGERSSNVQEAVDSLTAKIAPALRKAIADNLKAEKIPVPQAALPSNAVALLSLRPADGATEALKVLRAQRVFMDAVAKTEGVVACRLAEEKPEKKAYIFRVEYDPAAFPGGLLNTVVLSIPDLGDGAVLEIER